MQQGEQGEGRVRIEDGVVFGRGGERELRCDVFHPPGAGTNRVGVVLIHGGAWREGDRSQLRSYGIRLARTGVVCAAIEYRLSGEAKWPACLHDVKTALRWMRANSQLLGIDPQKVCVSGNSAGGHLALMAAATADVPELEGAGGDLGQSTACAACVAFYPPTQLFGSDRASTPPLDLFEPNADIELIRKASPISYARADFPPTMLLHGNRDKLVQPGASLAMFEALSRVRAPVELHMYNGAPHAFDATREFARHCAELMLLFLDRHVARPHEMAAAWAGLQALTTSALGSR